LVPLISTGTTASAFNSICFAVVDLVLAIGGFIIILKSIGEAHKLSAAKAFQCTLIPGLLVGISLVLIVVIYSLIT
jgi:hypothetical protein